MCYFDVGAVLVRDCISQQISEVQFKVCACV